MFRESGEQHDFQFIGATEVEILFMFIHILMSAGEMCEVLHWSELVLDRAQSGTFVTAVMNCWVSFL
jgi:hypothetical protein